MSKTATFFTHKSIEGPARLVSVLEELGFDLTHIYTPAFDLKDFEALAPDLLIVMGGPMGVYEMEEYPYLVEEVEILKARIAADKPTLGICLGAQLIAEALGTTGYKGDVGFEVGWAPLQVNEAGKKTPVKYLDGAKTNMFHFHQDTFDLPDGATLLASSAMFENQIFSYGKSIMALQCHPEVEPAQLDKWCAELIDCNDLENDIKKPIPELMPDMDKQFRKFMHEWLNGVGLIS